LAIIIGKQTMQMSPQRLGFTQQQSIETAA